MRTIYYKNGQLNKTKTVISLAKYYVSDRLHGRVPQKLVVESSERE